MNRREALQTGIAGVATPLLTGYHLAHGADSRTRRAGLIGCGWYGKNDLLAPDSFAASVTHAEPGPPAGNSTRNPWPRDDPRFYTFLWEKGGDRRSTGDYANVQSAARILGKPSSKPFPRTKPFMN